MTSPTSPAPHGAGSRAVAWLRRRVLRRRGIGAPPPAARAVPARLGGDVRLRLAVAGDVGVPGPDLRATVGAMAAQHGARPYDGLVLLGDNVYPSGDPDLVGVAVLEPFAPLLDEGVALYAALGNHDCESGRGDEIATRLGMPARWYQVRFDDLLLVVLDSTRITSAEQLAFLDRCLADAGSRFTVVALHHPPVSSGWHGPDRMVAGVLLPVLERHGVDLVLAGHEHDYQRSVPVAGTVHIVTGGAAQLRPAARDRFTAVAWSTLHFGELVVEATGLRWRAIDAGGACFDDVVIVPARQPS